MVADVQGEKFMMLGFVCFRMLSQYVDSVILGSNAHLINFDAVEGVFSLPGAMPRLSNARNLSSPI